MIQHSYFGQSDAKLKLGLIGTGIQRSRTPAMHEREVAEYGLTCRYQLIDLEALGLQPDALPEIVDAAESAGFAGLNITHPCKQLILPLLTDISTDARIIGAVNTVVFRDGRRYGHNTDWLGFREGLSRGLAGASMQRVVQLGAGGGGAATAYALLKLGAGHLTIIDPNTNCSETLVDRYGAEFGSDRVSVSMDIAASIAAAHGLVHATPTGMKSHPGLPLPATLLRNDLWVAEIVYFPLETELLRQARAIGCRTVDGSEMAIHQAIEAFFLFTGVRANPNRMRRHFSSQQEP